MTVYLASDRKIAETSSKGNQEKWRDGSTWYKVDQFGYEALAEVTVSRLLEKSNIETAFPFTFVRYSMVRLQVHGRERTGCSSPDFLGPGESIVTLAHLFRQYLGRSAGEVLEHLSSDKKRMIFLAEETARITGLSRFPEYLTLLSEIDGLVLNDDRHLNNIAVLYKDGRFGYCPIFDHGAGLLSNVMYAPYEIVPASLVAQAKARPLRTTFNRQVRTMEGLYGRQLAVPVFSRDELMQQLQPLLEYYPARDRELIADRVCETIRIRQKQMK